MTVLYIGEWHNVLARPVPPVGTRCEKDAGWHPPVAARRPLPLSLPRCLAR